MQITPASSSLLQAAASMMEEQQKYPLKWAICYLGKPYIALYGKKKAHDLLYHLSKSFVGLTIIPLEPGNEKAARSLNGLVKANAGVSQRA